MFDEDDDKEPATLPATVIRKPQKISLFDDEEEVKPQPVTKPKKISLFDDDDDLFKDDLFSGITTKKLTSNLFDDIGESTENLFATNVNKKDTPKVDLFGDLADAKEEADKNVIEHKSEVNPRKKIDLFSAEEDLFGVKPTEVSPNTKTDDVGTETAAPVQISGTSDEVDKSTAKPVDELAQREVIGAEKLSTEAKVIKGLFDDSPKNSDSEELFKEPEVKETQYKSSLFEDQPLESGKKSIKIYIKFFTMY